MNQQTDKEKHEEYIRWRRATDIADERHRKWVKERQEEIKRTIKKPIEDAAKAMGCRVTMARDWDIGYLGPRYDLWRARLTGDWIDEWLLEEDIDRCDLMTSRDLDYIKWNIGKLSERRREVFDRLSVIIAALNKVTDEWKLDCKYTGKRKDKLQIKLI